MRTLILGIPTKLNCGSMLNHQIPLDALDSLTRLYGVNAVAPEANSRCCPLNAYSPRETRHHSDYLHLHWRSFVEGYPIFNKLAIPDIALSRQVIESVDPHYENGVMRLYVPGIARPPAQMYILT